MVEEMLSRGLAVTGTYLNTTPPDHLADIEWLKCDVRDAGAVRNAVKATRPDGVIHLAAMSVPVQANADPITAYQTNVMGALHLLEAVRREAPACRVLLISSCHVYGNQPLPETGLCEELPLLPVDVYGATRAAGETAASVFRRQHDVDVVIARPFNHSGPRQQPKYFVASLARQVARVACGTAPPEVQLGNVDVVRDFSDIGDVVRAYATLMAVGKRGQAYNVCSGRPVSLRSIFEMMREISGCDLRIARDPQKMRPAEVPTIFGDPSLIRKTTGWAASTKLEDTLRRTFEYWKEHSSAQAAAVAAAG
jgi:GDP-4-dehydro-6-deoxy-D-mannose reductase